MSFLRILFFECLVKCFFMKYHTYIIKRLVVLLVLWLPLSLVASTVIEGGKYIGFTESETGRELYIGPDAIIQVDGEWWIYSSNVYIHPNAVIFGTGLIIFKDNAIINGGTSVTVNVDGGGALIDCDVRLENPANMNLTHIDPPVGTGWSTDMADDIYLGKDFDFFVDDGHVINNGNDAIFDADASISNYNENRYFVTNDTGTVSKEALGGSFDFPVGHTENTGINTDYTPATLNNTGTADRYNVRVDHTVTDETLIEDVMREWFISEEVAGGSNVFLTLQHNIATARSDL